MEQKMDVYSKIQHLLADEPSDWLAENKRMEMEEDAPWLKISQTVALRILGRLREINMSQNELADKIGISRQQVNKWLKGRENFTIETLTRLGGPVGMTLEELVQSFPKKDSAHLQEEKAEIQLQG
jgi:plasmid maintenance system antidote protein VapI